MGLRDQHHVKKTAIYFVLGKTAYVTLQISGAVALCSAPLTCVQCLVSEHIYTLRLFMQPVCGIRVL